MPIVNLTRVEFKFECCLIACKSRRPSIFRRGKKLILLLFFSGGLVTSIVKLLSNTPDEHRGLSLFADQTRPGQLVGRQSDLGSESLSVLRKYLTSKFHAVKNQIIFIITSCDNSRCKKVLSSVSPVVQWTSMTSFFYRANKLSSPTPQESLSEG